MEGSCPGFPSTGETGVYLTPTSPRVCSYFSRWFRAIAELMTSTKTTKGVGTLLVVVLQWSSSWRVSLVLKRCDSIWLQLAVRSLALHVRGPWIPSGRWESSSQVDFWKVKLKGWPVALTMTLLSTGFVSCKHSCVIVDKMYPNSTSNSVVKKKKIKGVLESALIQFVFQAGCCEKRAEDEGNALTGCC